jgi:hypothetical protein
MPIRDVAAQNASLDNDYGATHGPNAPDSHELALFDADPTVDGVELADTTEVDDGAGGTTTVANGYARVTVTNDATWAAADGGRKETVDPVQFADAVAAWETARYWALIDPVTGYVWDCAPLAAPVDVSVAGPGPAVVPAIFFDSYVVAPDA